MSRDFIEYALRKGKKRGSSRPNVFQRLMAMEDILVKAGFPKMSPWWKKVIKSFYEDGKLRLVARVGRRGGKSTTICRWAVAEALFGSHKIPPGDIGKVVIISTKLGDAKERIRTIGEILTAMRIGFVQTKEMIALNDKPIEFQAYPANFRTSVGMTTIFLFCDEMARWRDDEMGANPAKEVLKSVVPSMLTMPNAKQAFSSSPWSTMDAHYDYFERGSDDTQMCVWAETWVANQTLTEQRCKEIDPDAGLDQESFDREYRAIPMKAGMHTFFDPEAIENAVLSYNVDIFSPSRLLKVIGRVPYETELMAGGDFAFTSDWSGLYVMYKAGEIYHPAATKVIKPEPGQPLKPSETCREFAEVLSSLGVECLMADGHYRESVVEHLHPFNIAFLDAPNRRAPPYIRFRTLLYQERMKLPNDLGLIEDMKEVQAKPTQNSGLSIIMPKRKGKGGGHADLMSAMVLAAYQKSGTRYEERKEQGYDGWDPDELAEVERAVMEIQGVDGPIAYSEREWLSDDW